MLDRFELNKLFDIYEPLLTKTQKEIFSCYYLQDNSLGEIAESFEISRQAVHDLLKRTEKILLRYESLLRLNDRFNALLEIANELENDKDVAISKLEQCEIAKRIRESVFFIDEQGSIDV